MSHEDDCEYCGECGDCISCDECQCVPYCGACGCEIDRHGDCDCEEE